MKTSKNYLFVLVLTAAVVFLGGCGEENLSSDSEPIEPIGLTVIEAEPQIKSSSNNVVVDPAGEGVVFETGDIIYHNPMAEEEDLAGWVAEGALNMSFPWGRMRLENGKLAKSKKEHGHFVFWCPVDFPADIAISFKYTPVRDLGLTMLWVGATGINGEDIFDDSLAPRDGEYRQYCRGDINAYHLSFNRRNPTKRILQVCNLRKSYGFHLVAQGGDPIPVGGEGTINLQENTIELIKCGNIIRFTIDGIKILEFHDDGETYGPLIGGGKFGIRQMAGRIAEYRDLTIRTVKRVK